MKQQPKSTMILAGVLVLALGVVVAMPLLAGPEPATREADENVKVRQEKSRGPSQEESELPTVQGDPFRRVELLIAAPAAEVPPTPVLSTEGTSIPDVGPTDHARISGAIGGGGRTDEEFQALPDTEDDHQPNGQVSAIEASTPDRVRLVAIFLSQRPTAYLAVNRAAAKPFRVGDEFLTGMTMTRIYRDYVDFEANGQILRLKVGQEMERP